VNGNEPTIPMTIARSNYVSVPARAAALGYTVPDGLVFLPDNFEAAQEGDQLRLQGEATTISKLLRQEGILIERLGPSSETAFIHNRSHDWALPIIFVGAELMKQSPDMIGTAIDVIRDYLIKLFEGTAGKKIKAEIVLEERRGKRYQKITYEGDAEGLSELEKLCKRLIR
jgi:hypothetical protein